jgi:hypothetical protein
MQAKEENAEGWMRSYHSSIMNGLHYNIPAAMINMLINSLSWIYINIYHRKN